MEDATTAMYSTPTETQMSTKASVLQRHPTVMIHMITAMFALNVTSDLL
jgi:hypothetical protein